MKISAFSYKIFNIDITIVNNGNSIINILANAKIFTNDIEIKETKLIKETFKQLNEYFNQKRKTFDIPIELKGTEFQKKVWSELIKIPYGETRSYQDIAKNIGGPHYSRAVGMANNKNPIMFIVPCHRVIGKNGDLVGFGGGLELKKFVLELENTNI